jgi:hypothetical protein
MIKIYWIDDRLVKSGKANATEIEIYSYNTSVYLLHCSMNGKIINLKYLVGKALGKKRFCKKGGFSFKLWQCPFQIYRFIMNHTELIFLNKTILVVNSIVINFDNCFSILNYTQNI